MLEFLEILNGEMTPKFDKYVNNYTVEVKDEVLVLDIKYEVMDDVLVTITNNNLVEGQNYVYLELVKGEEKENYTLEVYKESSRQVFEYNDYNIPVEINSMPTYIPPLIIGSCFLIIAFCYLIIFRKKQKK